MQEYATFFQQVSELATFSPEKMKKITLFQGDELMVGLNCLRPGQEHAPHAHAGADKAYYVVSGRGEFIVNERTEEIGPGGLIVAPKNISHGVKNVGPESLVVLVMMAPAPT